MDTPTSGVDMATDPARAGFWRRFASILIDSIIVMLPLQLLAAALFAMTAGTVQMPSGFLHYCEHGGSKHIPEQLRPLAPLESNFIKFCRTSFFGMTTGRTVTVGRTTQEGNLATTVTMSYLQDKDDKVIKGIDIDWVFYFALIIYLVAMISKHGRTLGGRAVRIRVIDAANPRRASGPAAKGRLRYLVMFIGVMPIVAFYAYQYWSKGGIADAMFTAETAPVLVAAALFGFIWALTLTIQIAKKTDPIYDRAAGTAVIRALPSQ